MTEILFAAWRRMLPMLGIAILIFLVAPLFVIVPFSFNVEPYFSLPIPAYSMRWYAELAGSAMWHAALRNSLLIAIPTTVLATAFGTLAAIGLTLAAFPGKGAVLALIMAPAMVPHIILGLGLFFLYAEIGLVHTLGGMILAHTTLATPFVVLTVSATLANFRVNLIRAGLSLGAHPVTVYRRVVLPVIMPGLLSGALFAFITSFDEVVVALLLSGPEYRTLPRQFWSGIQESISPVIMAAASLLTLFSVAMLGLIGVIRRRERRYQAGRIDSGRQEA